jgi:flagellar motor switch protein FliN/FliY
MENPTNDRAARIFAGTFAENLGESLSKAAGNLWRISVLDNPDLSTRHGQSVHFRLTAEGGLRGECFIEFCQPQVTELAVAIVGQPATAFGDEHERALAKEVSAALALTAAALKPTYGEVKFQVQRVEGLAFGGMFVVPFDARGGDKTEMPLYLYFDTKVLASLSNPIAGTDPAGTEKPPIDLLNLKLVMDVELNVSLRFGQRQLPLREVLELKSGSVVELDRQVDDPVELLLDGKVIARGEAVIVDGNYGLRITDIPQPIASHFIR